MVLCVVRRPAGTHRLDPKPGNTKRLKVKTKKKKKKKKKKQKFSIFFKKKKKKNKKNNYLL